MEKKNPYYKKSMSLIPRFSPYDGFCCIFLCYWKLMEKPMHFPFDEVYHRMGIIWKKKHTYFRKIMTTNFPGSFHRMGFVAFSLAMGNLWENPCIAHVMKYTIGQKLDGERSTHIQALKCWTLAIMIYCYWNLDQAVTITRHFRDSKNMKIIFFQKQKILERKENQLFMID